MKKTDIIFTIISCINLAVFVILAGTNRRLATNEEARAIAAGVSHWLRGEFELANDSPPLARMVSVLPLLPLDLRADPAASVPGVPGDGWDPRARELTYAGHFLGTNHPRSLLNFLARMPGFLWWVLWGWIIYRWSGRLHGRAAGYLGLALWACAPVVLDHERFATPDLPAAVICLAATFALRSYLGTPSWRNALLAGLVLGIAQLVEYVALALLLIWPLLALAHRLSRGDGETPRGGSRTPMLQTAAALAVSVWVINVGYGFCGSGSPLGSPDFAGVAPGGSSPPFGERPGGQALADRSRGRWIGRVPIPLPVDYVNGLDRRWHERETALARRIAEGSPVELAGRADARDYDGLPIGVWLLMLASLILLVSRPSAGASRADELALWLPALAFLALPMQAIGPLSPSLGVLLATPFVILIATRIAGLWDSSRRVIGWVAVVLALGGVGDCLRASCDRLFTLSRTMRIRQDLASVLRKMGLPAFEPKTSLGIGAQERGLLYRSVVDSRGIERNYALYVPEGYRGDRPYPLILFLHGYGERGTTDTDRMYTEYGLSFQLKCRGGDFLVLCPQGHSGTWEADGDDARAAMELLAAVQGQYRVDPKRISLTGLSSGGTGVWGLAARFPDRWAAIVPVSGSVDLGRAPAIKPIPCWCFHDRYDRLIPMEEPRRMIKALRALGGSPEYTEFLDTNHSAGDRTYAQPELYEWLARQRLP